MWGNRAWGDNFGIFKQIAHPRSKIIGQSPHPNISHNPHDIGIWEIKLGYF